MDQQLDTTVAVKEEVTETAVEPEGMSKSDLKVEVDPELYETYGSDSLKIITNLCKNLQQAAVDGKEPAVETLRKEMPAQKKQTNRRRRKATPQKWQKENSVEQEDSKSSTVTAKMDLEVMPRENIKSQRQLRSSRQLKPKTFEVNLKTERVSSDSEESISLQEVINRKRTGTNYKSTRLKTREVISINENRCGNIGQTALKNQRRKTKRQRVTTKGAKQNNCCNPTLTNYENLSKTEPTEEKQKPNNNGRVSKAKESMEETEKAKNGSPQHQNRRKQCKTVAKATTNASPDHISENKNSADSQDTIESDSEESDGLQEFLDAVEPKKPKYKPRRKPQLSEEQKAEKERRSIEKRTCKVCHMVFAFPAGLRNHMRSKHTFEKPYSCEFCEEKFAIQSSCALHRRRHLGIKPHLCNLCGKTFLRKMDMRIHMRIHVPFKDKIRDVKCSFCPKVYTSKINLRKHTLTKHTDPSEWKHECQICGKKLYSATALTLHVRQHNDDRSFKCVICGRGFFTKQNMNIHVRAHSADTPFNCELCLNPYCSNEALQRHRLKVHGIGEEKHLSSPSYFCPICHEGFRQRARLEQHVELHETGEEEYPFECEKCHKRYKARNNFTIHMMDKHAIMIDDSYFKMFHMLNQRSYTAASDTTSIAPENFDYSDNTEDMKYKNISEDYKNISEDYKNISEDSNSEQDEPNE